MIKGLLRSLRVRLAVTGFLTAYAPTLALLIVGLLLSRTTETDIIDTTVGGRQLRTETNSVGVPLRVVVAVAIGFAPFAAIFAWWWSGRALRPLAEAVSLQERLMEETSHELRTPLAVLSNSAQVLLAHPEPTIDVYREGLERSEAMAARMSETIDSLLVDARGRARTIARVPTDLAELTRLVVESLTSLAEDRNVTLDLVTADALAVPVDPPSVARAVTNLVTNAIQHGAADSTVGVEVVRDGGVAKIIVTDHGPGIAPADQAKIFERYWQADDGDGSGIGLAIVAQVAEAHGGSVSVTSPLADRSGARFTLTLTA